MQLRRLTVCGLFGHLNHTIAFPSPSEQSSRPSVVILHGRNGIGKTTLLRMLDGMLRLDFNVFRKVPFETCSLEFDSALRLDVKAQRDKNLVHLAVSYGDSQVLLHPEHPGPIEESDEPTVEQFRQAFFRETESISFEFIDTERLSQLQTPDEDEIARTTGIWLRRRVGRTAEPNRKSRTPTAQNLAARVRQFITEAQVNYRTFFSTTEPDLFPRIIERLTSAEQPSYDISNLRARLQNIHTQDINTARLGLEPDRWDLGQIMALLDTISQRSWDGRQQAVTVLGSYVEQLESRAAERALVADRLLTFERLMREFLGDKSVLIDPRLGFRIQSRTGQSLNERQLSSGEFHLLFLMVAALVTRRRGTVIAIDEPEMSMHIEWQRKLIPALVDSASKAEPLFVFATHSPDLAASFPDAMVELH